MARLLIISIFTLIIGVSSFGQSKKEIRDRNIQAIKVYEERPQKSQDKIIESITRFNKSGNIIEEIEYKNDGEFKKHEKFEYDESGNKIKVIELDASGKIIKTITYAYKDGLRIERIEYDEKGKIESKKTYVYETF